MSFLRNIRNNLSNSSNHSTLRTTNNNNKPKPSSAMGRNSITTINERSARTTFNGTDSDYGTYGTNRRHSSNVPMTGNTRRGSNSTTLRRGEEKYGKENPAPIIVFVDKYETMTSPKKKPAGILRNNTFTKGDREPEQKEHRRRSGGSAIARSDTFTINESENEENGGKNTNTFTKKKKSKEKSQENLFDQHSRKNSADQEKLPVVVDSRTYRKKSLKTSKPVQKVESFIKRVEKSLFKHDSKKNARKDSNASDGTYVPKFRDIGINCKLDDEYKLKTRKKRQGSRDSLLETAVTQDHSSSSQRSYRDRSTTPQNSSRERSASPTKRYPKFDREVTLTPPEKPRRAHERSPSPFETLELKSKPIDNSFLKARQKEIEMGYSTVNKKPSLVSSADRNKSILVNTTRTERFDPDRGRSYTVTTSTHRVEYDRPHPPSSSFRTDTYSTLKEEYEQANRKPVGIASPRLNSDRPRHEPSTTPIKPSRKDSTELPKYTFGTNLQERRSRFQEFQKSFKKVDDDDHVTHQQTFFVPI